MSNEEEAIEFEGVITETLPGGKFKVMLDNEHEILAHISGKIRKNRVRVLLGDRVKVEVSPYDITKGRIVHRFRV